MTFAFAGFVAIWPFLFALCVCLKLLFWGGFIASQLWPLAKIPGPRWASYTRFWLMKTLASGRSAEIFVEVNKTYGSLARIGPNHLITSDPELTRRILASGSRYKRAPGFDSLRIDPHVANVASERDSEKHNRLRLQLSRGYASKDIKDTELIIDKLLYHWLRRIDHVSRSQPGESRAFDIGRRIRFLTVDLITRLCLGEAFGCIEDDCDQYGFLEAVQIGSAVSQQFWVIHEISRLLFYLTKIPFMRRRIVPSPNDSEGLGKVIGVIHRAVDKRFQSEKKPAQGMLDSFLEKGLSREQADTELVISLVAGSDTTSTAVQSTLMAIISNPRVYEKLQHEIEQAISQDLVSNPIQEAEANRLPYLQACILEGLRKHPPVGQLRERMVPPEGDSILGYRVPGGTFIGFNGRGTQLNAVFGDDPEVFRPERWLIEEENRLREMQRVHSLIFGHGSTRCLGIRIAKMELNKSIFELLRYFDITSIDPHHPWKSTCYGLFFQDDFNVRITRREGRKEIPAFDSSVSCSV